MIDNKKTKKQLIEEIEELRQQVVELKIWSVERSNSDTTDSKQAGEDSCTCTKAIETVLDAVSIVAVQGYDGDGTIRYWSKANEDVYGYTAEEALGKNIVDLIIPPEMRTLVQEIIRKGAETGIMPPPSEFLLMRKDGSRVPVHSSHPVIRFPDGTVRLFCVDVNLSVLKETEKALRKNEDKFRTYIQSAPDAIFVINAKGHYVEVNRAACELTGYSMSELVAMSIPDIVDPETYGETRKGFENLKRTGRETSEFRLKRKDGSIICASLNAVALSEDSFIAFCSDITERKQAEQALRDSEEKYRTLFESSSQGVLVADAETRKFMYANSATSRMFGYSIEQLKTMSIEEIHPTDDLPQVISEFKAQTQGLKAMTTDIPCIRQGGTVFYVDISAAMTTFDGRECSVAFLSDITEIKRLRELKSRAERLNMAGIIAGQVAHDFNNLLAPMVAYPEFIREELPPGHNSHIYLDAIENAANKIADINQDLLTLSRRGHFNQKVLDINLPILQIVQEMKSRSRTITYEINLCEDLMNIMGSGAQIHRMLNNLLVNAHDAIEDIGQITVKTENYYADNTSVIYDRIPKGEYIKLTISDTGCGISEDIIQKIVDPFFSTKTANKKRGSGLGLSVVDAVIKDHSGYLDISSKVGQGTSFYLYFPITRECPGENESQRLTSGTETVLVVDDDNVQREVSTQLLSKLGYNVSSVESGEKAIGFLRENPRDLVILDMVMPGGIDGTETYRRILKINTAQKAIILSGLSESDRVIEAQKLGTGAFVKKPITKHVIAKAVREELDRKKVVAS